MQLEENVDLQTKIELYSMCKTIVQEISVKLLRKLLDIIFTFYRKHTLRGVCGRARTWRVLGSTTHNYKLISFSNYCSDQCIDSTLHDFFKRGRKYYKRN